ncbi:uncharacterized protein [Amphiura filiformis]|uniref:uncharacterized protein n=1 Tax=Amphiura filiformis TaxID=82378 RepID=UPI003B216C57
MDILNVLDEKSLLITQDWAMKFFPRKYRESQSDWFGKRGLSWHISVAIWRRCNQQLEGLTVVHIRQENAGCYHSAETILGMQKVAESAGVQIRRMDFSDPQGGKGPCDRRAASLKAHIRIHINEGHNVEDALEMKSAIEAIEVDLPEYVRT